MVSAIVKAFLVVLPSIRAFIYVPDFLSYRFLFPPLSSNTREHDEPDQSGSREESKSRGTAESNSNPSDISSGKMRQNRVVDAPNNRFLRGIARAAEMCDVTAFHTKLKSFAYHNTGEDYSQVLYPVMMTFKERVGGLGGLDPTAISDWLWSIPRVGLRVGNLQHRKLTMELLHALVEGEGEGEGEECPGKAPGRMSHEYYGGARGGAVRENFSEPLVSSVRASPSFPVPLRVSRLTPRQVTTSLGGIARMRLKWNQLQPQTQADIIAALDAAARNFNDRFVYTH